MPATRCWSSSTIRRSWPRPTASSTWGPGAGEHGGAIVFNGPAREIVRCEDSLTGDYLAGRRRIDVRRLRRRKQAAAQLTLTGATLHNVRNVTLEVPLGRLVCVTGVSGSGKSTLVTSLLYPALQRALRQGHGIHGPVQEPHRTARR